VRRLSEHASDLFGLGPATVEVVEEAIDPPQRLVARTVEAAVDLCLHTRAHRPEGDCDGEGRCGSRHGGPAAQGDAETERHRHERRAEHRGKQGVDERRADEAIDLVEAVAQHRDPDRAGNGDLHRHEPQERRPRRHTGEPLEGPDENRDRDEDARVGDPLQLRAQHALRASEAHDKSEHRSDECNAHPEQPDCLEDAVHGTRQHVEGRELLERSIERLAREQAPEEHDQERGGPSDRPWAPAG